MLAQCLTANGYNPPDHTDESSLTSKRTHFLAYTKGGNNLAHRNIGYNFASSDRIQKCQQQIGYKCAYKDQLLPDVFLLANPTHGNTAMLAPSCSRDIHKGGDRRPTASH